MGSVNCAVDIRILKVEGSILVLLILNGMMDARDTIWNLSLLM